MRVKKTCTGCMALMDYGYIKTCALGHELMSQAYCDIEPILHDRHRSQPLKITLDDLEYEYFPCGKCPKPKTYKALTKLIQNAAMNPHSLDHVNKPPEKMRD